MKKIMITGASGMLGVELCAKLHNNFKVYPFTKNKTNFNRGLDIVDFDEVSSNIKIINPDVIINCAAFTNVDNVEKYKSKARNINVVGLLNIIKSTHRNVKIIHISSDYIFDGNKGSYKEDDIKNPLNYYGKTKLEAENSLIGSTSNYLIIRPNVLYTYDLTKTNFLSWVISSLQKEKKIDVVLDQISNPVYVPDLVNMIQDAILLDYSGICHFGSEDILSRYEFAIKISKIFNLNEKLINPVKTSRFKQIAQRPLNTSLNCTKIQSDLDIELFSTEYSLKRISGYL